ncbi:mucin-2-like isoform X7 [Anguilla anguilla]|uniref:mucin-2-like isoform X7 n=1 Tax=Anguilla anguilla TaxID=7936 RepID=UPI0015AAA651|nr:mucin-2-like isoform X7 [Anguilla anguilla]
MLLLTVTSLYSPISIMASPELALVTVLSLLFLGQVSFAETVNEQIKVCQTFGSGVVEPFRGIPFHLSTTCPTTLLHFIHKDVEYKIIITHSLKTGLIKKVEFILNKLITVVTDGMITVEDKSVSLPYDHMYKHIHPYGIYTKLKSKILELSVIWRFAGSEIDYLWVELSESNIEEKDALCWQGGTSENVDISPSRFIYKTEECQTRTSITLGMSCKFLSHFYGCFIENDDIPNPFQKYSSLCKANIYYYENTKTLECAFYSAIKRYCDMETYEPGWKASKCPKPTCPGDLIYMEQGNPFTPTCSHPNFINSENTVETCVCPAGKVLNNFENSSRCIPKEECPCVYGGKIFAQGENRMTKCQSCTCENGAWTCIKENCQKRCIIEGGSVTTYDGKQYMLPKACTYVASQGLNWTIIIELSEDLFLGKVILQIEQKTYTFSKDSVKFENEEILELHLTEHVMVFWQSSMYVQVQTSFGMKIQVQVKPKVQLYVTLPKSESGKVKGLCGNHNDDTRDDFIGRSEIRESVAEYFALSWVMGTCNSKTPGICNSDVDKYAHQDCSYLMDPSGIFASCHNEVPSEDYVKACEKIVCNCEGNKDCLCVALGNYAKACLNQGIDVGDWRNTTSCVEPCNSGQMFSYDARSCNSTCQSLAGPDPACDVHDAPVEGCGCPHGSLLNSDGTCTTRSECQCYYLGKTLKPGNHFIGKTKCNCKDGKLDCPEPLGCSHGKTYVNCYNSSINTVNRKCASLGMPEIMSTICESGCYCPDGQYEDHNGTCVAPADCPCLFSGVAYKSGETVTYDCQACTCKGGLWACVEEACSGNCEVFGNGHYKTFDSKWYNFDGNCEYTLVEDDCGSGHRTFSIRAESVPCCEERLTCSRRITLELQGKDTLNLHDLEVGQIGNDTQLLYSVHTVGLYFEIRIPSLDITLTWDKHTRLIITLGKRWKNKVCGLCGNFNNNEQDDLQIRGSKEKTDALTSGNSWKMPVPQCSDATEVQFNCVHFSYCANWAERRCKIISSDIFTACHQKVDYIPYYKACVEESCSCSADQASHGFCTAVAAFAEACCEAGVTVNWRTPERCPIYCDYYNEQNPQSSDATWHYKSCGPLDIKICGKNYISRKLEGCYPTCPEDFPYFDENTKKCSKTCTTTTVSPTTTTESTTTVTEPPTTTTESTTVSPTTVTESTATPTVTPTIATTITTIRSTITPTITSTPSTESTTTVTEPPTTTTESTTVSPTTVTESTATPTVTPTTATTITTVGSTITPTITSTPSTESTTTVTEPPTTTTGSTTVSPTTVTESTATPTVTPTTATTITTVGSTITPTITSTPSTESTTTVTEPPTTTTGSTTVSPTTVTESTATPTVTPTTATTITTIGSTITPTITSTPSTESTTTVTEPPTTTTESTTVSPTTVTESTATPTVTPTTATTITTIRSTITPTITSTESTESTTTVTEPPTTTTESTTVSPTTVTESTATPTVTPITATTITTVGSTITPTITSTPSTESTTTVTEPPTTTTESTTVSPTTVTESTATPTVTPTTATTITTVGSTITPTITSTESTESTTTVTEPPTTTTESTTVSPTTVTESTATPTVTPTTATTITTIGSTITPTSTSTPSTESTTTVTEPPTTTTGSTTVSPTTVTESTATPTVTPTTATTITTVGSTITPTITSTPSTESTTTVTEPPTTTTGSTTVSPTTVTESTATPTVTPTTATTITTIGSTITPTITSTPSTESTTTVTEPPTTTTGSTTVSPTTVTESTATPTVTPTTATTITTVGSTITPTITSTPSTESTTTVTEPPTTTTESTTVSPTTVTESTATPTVTPTTATTITTIGSTITPTITSTPSTESTTAVTEPPTTTTGSTTVSPTTVTESTATPTVSPTTATTVTTIRSTITPTITSTESTESTTTVTEPPTTTTESTTVSPTTVTESTATPTVTPITATTITTVGSTITPTITSTPSTESTTTVTEPPTTKTESTTVSPTTVTETTATPTVTPTTATTITTIGSTITPTITSTPSTESTTTVTEPPTTTTGSTTVSPTTVTESTATPTVTPTTATTITTVGSTITPTITSTPSTESTTTVTQPPTTTTESTTVSPTTVTESTATPTVTPTTATTITTIGSTITPTITSTPSTESTTTVTEPPTTTTGSTTVSPTTVTESTATPTVSPTTATTITTVGSTITPTITSTPSTESTTTVTEPPTTTTESTTVSPTTVTESTTTPTVTSASTTESTTVSPTTVTESTTTPTVTPTTATTVTTIVSTITPTITSTTTESATTTVVCFCRDEKNLRNWSCGQTWTENCIQYACNNRTIFQDKVSCPPEVKPDCPNGKLTSVPTDDCCQTWKCVYCSCWDETKLRNRTCGQTWTENCIQYTCNNGTIFQNKVSCSPEVTPDCPNGKMRSVRTDDCCQTWECDCQCQVYGDPHYITFDGTPYDFLEDCSYILVEEKKQKHNFSVIVDNFNCVANASCVRAVRVQYGKNIITLSIVSNRLIVSEFNNVNVPQPYENQGIRITTTNWKVSIYIDAIRSYVSLTPRRVLVVNLAMAYFHGNTQGQCGECGGGACVRRNGDVEPDTCCDKTAYSWLYEEKEKPHCKVKDVSCNTTITVPQCYSKRVPLCELFNHKAFKECSKKVDLTLLKKNCLFDSCMAKNNSIDCEVLEKAASDCQNAGFCVDWRPLTNGSCDVKCPEGMIYKECPSTPTTICEGGRISTKIMDTPTAGCFCPGNKHRAGGYTHTCVSDCTDCVGPHGEPKEPGDVWEANCYLCTCDKITLTQRCEPKTRSSLPTCQDNETLVRFNSTGCCNMAVCVEKTCEHRGHTYKIGERWSDSAQPCVLYSCEISGITIENKLCAEEQCLEGSRVCDKQKGCYTCKNTCSPRMSRVNVTIDGKCTDEVELPVCEGQCTSHSRWNDSELRMEKECQCCQEKTSQEKSITLKCKGGSKNTFTYKHIVDCECQLCH